MMQLTEVNFLGHMAHPNIMRLLGYCRDEPEQLLVYEYASNKGFDGFLFTGGFGLVKYCRERSLNTRVMGTIGYAAPEYLSTGHLSTKCDIYSFGVVLLESMSGRRALDRNLGYGKQNLVDWASKVKLNRKNVKEIMDPGIQHNYPLQGASECFALALRCVAKESKDRPSSEEVLRSLEQIYALSK
ncbi:putative protein kinase RLK-Pelle-RLCK-VIIa-2 family [Helianthus annuus]|nr:putative protein kinase RLK-Pelle-RLCK-VIIa-2 family [Helianthus annuus]